MTIETIVQNCRRLLSFMKEYNDLTLTKEGVFNCSDLLYSYGKILDSYNLKEGVLLIENKSDFNELKDHASINSDSFKDLSEGDIEKFNFKWMGFNWKVENR